MAACTGTIATDRTRNIACLDDDLDATIAARIRGIVDDLCPPL